MINDILSITKVDTVYHTTIEHTVVFSLPGFSVALEIVLEVALVDQAGPKLTEICLSLPPDCRP